MSYYDDKENVEEYIKMAEGYDGSEFVPIRCHKFFWFWLVQIRDKDEDYAQTNCIQPAPEKSH